MRNDFKLVIKLMKFVVFSVAIQALFGEKKIVFRSKRIDIKYVIFK